MTPIAWAPAHPAFKEIIERFARAIDASPEEPLYLVGGVVRDHLLRLAGERPAKGVTNTAVADLDLVLAQDALPVARRVADAAGWAFYPLDKERGLARLVYTAEDGAQLVCDVSQQRGDSLEADLLGRDFTINAMAFAYVPGSPTVQLIDVCDGAGDLARGLLRRVTAESLSSDPLRLLRAVRLAAQFDFAIEAATRAQIPTLAVRIALSSPERIRDELWKALATPDPAGVVEELRTLGLLPHLLPEVAATVDVTQSPPHHLDVYQHTLRTVSHAAQLRDWLGAGAATDDDAISAGTTPAVRIEREMLASLAGDLRPHLAQTLAPGHSRGQWLIWHALLHDVGKPLARSVEGSQGEERIRFLGHEEESAELAGDRLAELRFSRREITVAGAVARHHMRPHFLHASFRGKRLSRRAIYRFFRHCDGQNARQLIGVDVALLALADYRATPHGINEQRVPDAQLDAWREYVEHVGQLLTFAFAADGWQAIREQPLLDGKMLMQALNLSPGRRVGQLLEQLAEAQAAGEIRTADQALQLAATLEERLAANPE